MVLRSLLFWAMLTVVVSTAMVLRPGLNLARTMDDYMGYWDFRLVFFLMVWVPISLPVWALATYIISRRKK